MYANLKAAIRPMEGLQGLIFMVGYTLEKNKLDAHGKDVEEYFMSYILISFIFAHTLVNDLSSARNVPKDFTLKDI